MKCDRSIGLIAITSLRHVTLSSCRAWGSIGADRSSWLVWCLVLTVAADVGSRVTWWPSNKVQSGGICGMAYPTYPPQHLPVKLRLRHLLELKPLEQKYVEGRSIWFQQMAVHEVVFWVQAIREKPLPMHWMHNLNIQMLGELLQLHPLFVTSEFGKVGMARN